MENIPHDFLISYQIPGAEPQRVESTDCSRTLSDLLPGTAYTISVSTVTEDGKQSEPATATIWTRLCLNQLLSQIGLKDYYENKLTLSTALEINTITMSDETIKTMQSLSSVFLKKLMMSNVNSRSVKCVTTPNSNINPLDLITAMFLCSDGFLQQEMVLKMSMCQFAVPLLLPNCETKQSTLMVWAMRDIVKKCRTSQTATKSFVEVTVVHSDMPMVSFVRLGESCLPKSQTLNKLLTNPQDYYDTYIHRNMASGNVQREISDGLVEISWYLPSGNTDVFKKPVAMANLRVHCD
ncbi:up-regulator of cell proliferation-like [Aplochiton taeniatus]